MNTMKLCALYAIGGLIVGYLMGLGHMLQLDDDVNCAVHGVCDAEIPPSLSMMEQEMPRWWYCGWYCPEYRGVVEKAMGE